MSGNGFEFVWAAYGLTAVVLVGYAAGLWIRAARLRARRADAEPARPLEEVGHA